MWKNIVEPDRPQMETWRMRIACWILKATNTHSQYVILIAFPLQQPLHEGASALRQGGRTCTDKMGVGAGTDIVFSTSKTHVCCTHRPTKWLSAPARRSVS